jgi:hypothetical protein
MSYNTDKERKLTTTEAVRGLLYGVEGLIPNVNRIHTRRKLAQVRNLLMQIDNLIKNGIAEGLEDRTC